MVLSTPTMNKLAALVVTAFLACPVVHAQPEASRRQINFKRDVYPILKDNCFRCHQGSDAESGVRLDVRAELLGETNGKRLVQVGKSEKSRLIQLVSGSVPGKTMPPGKKSLNETQIAVLKAWIEQGLAWDSELLPPEGRSTHWAFQPVKKPVIPGLKNGNWVRNPIDAFIVAQHESKGLVAAAEAERRVLVRRLTLDLTGLPPTLEQLHAAVNDPSQDWYEKVVERLLASTSYGERWGRHWLDLARWAESEGYESDHPRDYAWRYRDYVVHSFNIDKPYDRFLLEQIAGDELEPYTDDNLIATGFLAAARLSSNEEDPYQQRNDVLVDIVNATGSAAMGLTFHCAQCHNHKFDPITARDYYRFQGFFIKGAPNNLVLNNPALRKSYEASKPPGYDSALQRKKQILELTRQELLSAATKNLTQQETDVLQIPTEKRTAEQEKLARQAELKLQIPVMRIEKTVNNSPDKGLFQELTKQIGEWEKKMPDPPQTFGFYAPGAAAAKIDVLSMKGFTPPEYRPEQLMSARPYLLISGEVHQRGEEVDVGWPAIFGPTPKDEVTKKPRTALANWLSQPDHPLTARVWVNRIWQWHFGRGLVATSSDFGTRGALPTHPELLDWLAVELVRSGWSTKHLHRLIVGSNTYRQSSAAHSDNAKRDPSNTFYWRWSPRRLEAEAIRDSMLAVSGELDMKVGGPSDKEEAASRRRTLYLFQKRNRSPEIQKLLDGPAGATESCSKRNVSTVPLQALYLLNDKFTWDRAMTIADKARRQVGGNQEQQIEVVFRLILGRTPDLAEVRESRRFFETENQVTNRKDSLVLAHYCQALLNLHQFVYLE